MFERPNTGFLVIRHICFGPSSEFAGICATQKGQFGGKHITVSFAADKNVYL